MEIMKLIFLDIDGVLVTLSDLSVRLKHEKIVNEKCVKNLNRIIIETGAKIVISSAWRFNGLNEMRCILKFWGVLGEVIGATPDLRQASGQNLRGGPKVRGLLP